MDFTKIRYDGKKVTIEWRDDDDDDERGGYCKSPVEPEQSFRRRLQELVPLILELQELPTAYGDDLEVRSVAFSYVLQGRVGVSMHAVRPVALANGPVNINTPVVFSAAIDEEDDGPANNFREALFKAIDNVREEATRYLQGHRAQQSLGFEDDAEDVEPEAEPEAEPEEVHA